MVSNPHTDKLTYPASVGAQVTTDNRQVVVESDLIVLAVKPQMFESVLSEFGGISAGKCFVSIAAGISVQWIKERLPGAYVIRVMPNTPLQLGLGATAVAWADDVPENLFKLVCDIFSSAGMIRVIPEELMDQVIPVSGSSPAFFFRMANAMVKWAETQGVDPETAIELAAAAMKGSAEMLLSSGKTPEELIRQVCSPGGTTLAALSAFDDRDFEELIYDAMTRCADRSKELGK